MQHFFFLILPLPFVCSNEWKTALLDDLLERYDKRIFPSSGDGPVLVNMTIVLGILIELKENEQLSSFVISHTQKWRDGRISWNPAKYGGLQEAIVPSSLVWIPKIFVYNSVETKEMLSPSRADLRANYQGLLKINIPQYVSAICRVDTSTFPFDCQFCAVALASPLLNINEMAVETTQPPTDSYFTGNAEWSLFNITVRHMSFVEEGEFRAEVHYVFHLRRRPIYYITVIVAPTFLISALSILGIFSPGSSDGPRNEKVSLGLGSLLAMTVLLGIVAGSMPKSNSIPLLGYYILITICLCALSVAVSMAFLAISRQNISNGKSSPPAYFPSGLLPSSWTLHLLLLPDTPKKRRSTVFQSIITHGDRVCYKFSDCSDVPILKTKEIPKQLTKICTFLEEIAASQRSAKRKAEQKLQHQLVKNEWGRVFSRFDYIFLFLFELLNLAALGIFLQAAWMPTPELREQLI